MYLKFKIFGEKEYAACNQVRAGKPVQKTPKINKKTQTTCSTRTWMLVLNLRDLWKKVSLEEGGLDLQGHSASGMVILPSPATPSLSSCADKSHNGKVEYSRGTSEYDLYAPSKIK